MGFFSALPPHSQHQKQSSTRGEVVSRNIAASGHGSDSSRRRTVPPDAAASIENFRGVCSAAHSQGRLRESLQAAAAGAGAKEPVISGSENVMDGKQSQVGFTDADPADNTTAGGADADSGHVSEHEKEGVPGEVPDAQPLDLTDDPGAWDDLGQTSAANTASGGASDTESAASSAGAWNDTSAKEEEQKVPMADKHFRAVEQRRRSMLQAADQLGMQNFRRRFAARQSPRIRSVPQRQRSQNLSSSRQQVRNVAVCLLRCRRTGICAQQGVCDQ